MISIPGREEKISAADFDMLLKRRIVESVVGKGKGEEKNREEEKRKEIDGN